MPVSGQNQQLSYSVAPDYMAIGENDDFLYVPEWPGSAQKNADAFFAILPSRRIVDQIFAQAAVRLPMVIPPIARPVSPKMETTEAWVQVNDLIRAQLRAVPGYRLGALTAGEKKDVVVGPGLDGSRVAIYGGYGGTTGNTGKFWQPYSTIHPSNYSDYSHGIRLVWRNATLNGTPIDLVDLFQHPTLHVLVSDQGPFRPLFPNAGAGASASLNAASTASKAPLGSPAAASLSPSLLGELSWTKVAVGAAALGAGVWVLKRYF
jgi:hypothetical protein